MTLYNRHCSVASFFAGLVTVAVCGLGIKSEAAEPSVDEFDSIVKPFLRQHCADCHSGDEAEADFDIGQVRNDLKTDAAARVWESVLQALQFDDMPPPDDARPNSVAKAKAFSGLNVSVR